MPDEKPPGARFERWLNVLGSVVAPATLLGAVLFYFGYVSSRAQYDYFGVDVDTIGLSTQDYVMRSPQPLLVPLLALALLGAVLVTAHSRIRTRIDHPRFRAAVRRFIVLGLALVAVGVVMLFAYPLMADWAYYPFVTPLVLGVGGALAAYGLGTLRVADARAASASSMGSDAPRLAAIILVWAAVAACTFWLTATVAQWSGLGLARHQAQHLDDLPSVVVDTKERLYLPPQAGVTETALPAGEGAAYRFRYWGLRLLIVGDARLYLVPNDWDSHDTTLVLPFNDDIRIQFQFRNLAP